MKRAVTLSERVTWALAGAVAAFVALQGVLVYVLLAGQEDDLVDSIVLAETQRLAQRLATEDDVFPAVGAMEMGSNLRAWIQRPGSTTAHVPARIAALSPGSHQHHLDDLILHTVVADLPQGRIAVEFDATDNERRVYRFGMTLMLLWLIVSATGFWLARRIARLVIGPMVDVTDRIATWIPGAGSIQVDRDDEAGHLVEAFNRVQDQVDRSIAREREFTANLSHETRTPLTIIRTDAELLALSPGLDARQRERVRRIVTTIDDIAATIESARETRDDQPVRRETIALKRCVDDAWNGLEERAATRGLSLINEVPDRTYIEADRAGLLIVLRNLVRNAIDHAAPATLRVRSIAGGLEIADDGAGIAAEDLPFVFERYYRGRLSDTNTARDDGERGLGLAIAKRVCELRGWALTVRSSTQSPDRGTQFELVLKPSESLHQDVASMPG